VGGRGGLKTSYGGKGLAENVRYRNMGEGSKIAQKSVIWYFNVLTRLITL